jgi:small GTP-binding protein
MAAATPKEGEGIKEYLYKVLVVGDVGVGKTSIIKRYVHNIFSMHYKATIGVDFALKVLNWDAKSVVRLQLWDIAGQERFGNMTRVYYKEAVGAFVVFDVTRIGTFEAVQKWKADIDAKVTVGSEERPIPVVLLANKCDLAREAFVQTQEQMDAFCKEHKFAAWFETSAKDNIGIDRAARFLVERIMENDQNRQRQQDSDIVKPGDQPAPKKQEGCSC